MPDPFPQFRSVGLLGSTDLPTPSQYRVLCHLAEEGEPRLYLQDVGNMWPRASLSNTAHEAGRSVLCSVDFVKGPNAWVELDKATTRKAAASIQAYKINKRGFEMIAQYNAHHRYRKETVTLARRILREERAKVQALKPK